jgi:NADPH:quinone reductase-like Zn-dependent oxidoreductase
MLVEDGQVTPAVETTYPLEQAATAMQQLVDGRVRGKVAITVR